MCAARCGGIALRQWAWERYDSPRKDWKGLCRGGFWDSWDEGSE